MARAMKNCEQFHIQNYTVTYWYMARDGLRRAMKLG